MTDEGGRMKEFSCRGFSTMLLFFSRCWYWAQFPVDLGTESTLRRKNSDEKGKTWHRMLQLIFCS